MKARLDMNFLVPSYGLTRLTQKANAGWMLNFVMLVVVLSCELTTEVVKVLSDVNNVDGGLMHEPCAANIWW